MPTWKRDGSSVLRAKERDTKVDSLKFLAPRSSCESIGTVETGKARQILEAQPEAFIPHDKWRARLVKKRYFYPEG